MTAFCAAIAMAFLAMATRRYTSVSRMYIQEKGIRLLSADSQSGDPSAADSYLETQGALLHSSPVLQAALNQPDIQTLAAFNGVRDPMEHLEKELVVTIGKKDGILSVALETADPQDGVKIVDAVVSALVRFDSDQKRRKASELLGILQAEKETREQELDEQNRRIVAYKEANGSAFFQTEAGNVTMRDLAYASEQLTQARLATQWARALHDAANSTRAGTEALAQSRAREQNFQTVVNELEERARKVAALQAQCSMIEQAAHRTERQLDLLDARMKEVIADQHSGDLNFNVFENARTEPGATSPRTSLTLGLAVLLGLISGSATALLAEGLDHRIRTPEEVTQLLDLPVLGVIPARGQFGGRGSADGIHLAAPSSVTAEAYRSLRTSICFGASERGLKTILVASPSSSDGKSTTAANLAIALANSGSRTLLIDCDLRRPAQHLAFLKNCSPGLSDVLDESIVLSEDVIQQTDVTGLDILPSGTHAENPAELLGGTGFSLLLEQLSLRYDRIVIDSPPTLTFSDARILGSLCDGTLLVLRAMKSTHRSAQQATVSMLHVGARMIGAVFNGFAGTQNYGGGYYSEYEMRRELYRHAVTELARGTRKSDDPALLQNGAMNHGGNGHRQLAATPSESSVRSVELAGIRAVPGEDDSIA